MSSAQPMNRPTASDPADILRLLPQRWHQQFLAEYRAALDAAHEVWRWRQLDNLLHRWGLRATAYADPQFEPAARAARDAGTDQLTPVPGLEELR
jgi:hypothetical protein